MSALSDHELRTELRLNAEPLHELVSDENWWRLGPLAISKKHRTFRAGFGHPITSETRFELQSFDVDGRRGSAVILHCAGEPPEYFAGWVSREDEPKAREWVAKLNAEIERVLSDEIVSGSDGGANSKQQPSAADSIELDQKRLEIELRLHPEPIAGAQASRHWIRVGALSVSKRYPTVNIGAVWPIVADTRFEAQKFETVDKRGFAIVLHAGAGRPSYFAGWLPIERATVASELVAQMNAQVQDRLEHSSQRESQGVAQEDLAEATEVLTYQQGHEYAPDAPWGSETISVTRTGDFEYERRRSGQVRQRLEGSIDTSLFSMLLSALSRTAFPRQPQTMFPPGASVCTIVTQPPFQSAHVEYYDGLRLEGYGDLLRTMNSVCAAVRESNPEELARWSFQASGEPT
jgi:hypothetical protein